MSDLEGAVICRSGMGMSTEDHLQRSKQPPDRDAEQGGHQKSLIGQGTVVSGMTGVSRVTGFLRDILLSNLFGAEAAADAFFVAFRIPNFFRRMFAEGAFAQAFVPVLAEYRQGPRAALDRFVAVMLGNLATIVCVVCVFGVWGSDQFVRVFALGFVPGGERFMLASDLLRITFPYLALVSLSAFAGSVLNSFGRFAVTAFAPVLLNFVFIAVLLAAEVWPNPVIALAWGVLIGGVLQLAVQLPSLGRLGLLHRPRVDFRDPGARKVGRLIVPAIFAASVSQLNTLVDTMLASTLITGSISWLYYSDRLMELPIGLVAVALGTVLLPSLSRRISAGDQAGFRLAMSWGLEIAILLGVPAAVALYVLAGPLIVTVFTHGAMTEFDALMAAASLRAFSVGVVALVLIKVVHPAFFSRQDTQTPFRIGVWAVVTNIALNLALYQFMGHVGLALATAVAAVVNVYLLLRYLWIGGIYRPGPEVAKTAARAAIAATVMGICLWYFTPNVSAWFAMPIVERVVTMAVCVAGGLLSYVAVVLLTGQKLARLRQRF